MRASNEEARKKRQQAAEKRRHKIEERQQAYAQLALEHAEQEDRMRRNNARMAVAARTESLLAK